VSSSTTVVDVPKEMIAKGKGPLPVMERPDGGGRMVAAGWWRPDG
jgi:hypothetical protein